MEYEIIRRKRGRDSKVKIGDDFWLKSVPVFLIGVIIWFISTLYYGVILFSDVILLDIILLITAIVFYFIFWILTILLAFFKQNFFAMILFFVYLYYNYIHNQNHKTTNPILQKQSFWNDISRVSFSWLRLILLSSIIWATWYILYDVYNRTLREVSVFILQYFEPDYQVYTEIIQDYSTPLLYILRIGILRLGTLGIMIILALFFIIIIVFIKTLYKIRNLF